MALRGMRKRIERFAKGFGRALNVFKNFVCGAGSIRAGHSVRERMAPLRYVDLPAGKRYGSHGIIAFYEDR